MGMFDTVVCECYLPNRPTGIKDFQTKSFGQDGIGGMMDNYTINIDGELILHKVKMLWVEEKDRPYYGKPEWEENGIYRMMGCMNSVPVGDEVLDYHGILNIYSITDKKEWIEYNIKFTDGKVVDAKREYKEPASGD